MLKYEFNSCFSKHITEHIAQKRAMGYDYMESEYTLFTFDRFCIQNFPEETELTQEIALKWSEQRKQEGVRYQLNRITSVRQLALYMNSSGVSAYVVPFGIHQKSGQTQRHIPHIYTKEELSAIFRVADGFEFCIASPAMHIVVPVMFRLIYCCGLRPVEARRLRTCDVDFDSGIIKILESKGHKDRIVVMASDMTGLMKKYHEKATRIYPDRGYFFANNRGDGMYSMPRLNSLFREILKKANITAKNSSKPRPYDLRHTFATHRLYEWLQNGEDINSCLPYLSEYMGHSKLSSTAYYIHLVPEFYPKMAELGLEIPESIIPEVCDEG